MNGSGRIDSLDSVRGVAALVVVINHCVNLFPRFGGPAPGEPWPVPDPLLDGAIHSPLLLLFYGRGAVAIFFVLSGFVLALPWLRGRPLPYPLFVLRRVFRIYPPYAAAVALAMLLATMLAASPPPPLSAWFAFNWTEPVNATTILDHVLMLGAHNSFDNAIWSLNIELRLSLLFPLLLLPVLRFGLAGGAVAPVALFAAAWGVTHVYGWRGASGEAAATIRYGAFFVLGAMLAHASGRLATLRAPGLGWLALALGLGCLWASRDPALLAIGATLVVLAAVLPGTLRGALERPLLRRLGRISYSLYLTHLLVILSAVHVLAGLLPLPAIAAGGFLLSLPAAALFHRLVEAPSDALGRRLAAAWGGARPVRAAP